MSDPVIFQVADPQNPKEHNSVWFEYTTEKNDALSDAAGHPVFDTILLAHVIGPGLVKSEAVVVCERKSDGKVIENAIAYARYRQQIEAFKKGEDGGLTGTPLTELAAVDMATRASLKAMGVHSIEGLAAMNESSAHGFMGFRKFKMAAQAYLDLAAGQEPITKLTAALDAANEKLRILQSNYDDLAARVQASEDKKAKRAA